MRIELEIPEEFVKHFNHDRFEDSLDRLIADANCVAGNYEKETAQMLIKALKESKPAQDIKRSSNFSATETSQSDEQKDNSLYYEGYNRALDNFLDKISKSNQGHWRTTKYVHGEAVSQTMSYDIGTIKMIVEQLKELTQLD